MNTSSTNNNDHFSLRFLVDGNSWRGSEFDSSKSHVDQVNHIPPHRVYTSDEVAHLLLGTISIGQQFLTPDFSHEAPFTIEAVSPTSYSVATDLGSPLTIGRANIRSTYQYLLDNNVGPQNPLEIRSNNVRELAGPLCLAARLGGPRVINYILPILADLGIVGLNGQTQPNTVWIAPRNRVGPTSMDEHQRRINAS